MSWVDEQLALGDDLAARRALYVSRGIFGSPADAPARCEPNGGDRTMLSYECPDCKTGAWGVPAEPRAWGYDFDPLPESGWCPFCGAEGPCCNTLRRPRISCGALHQSWHESCSGLGDDGAPGRRRSVGYGLAAFAIIHWGVIFGHHVDIPLVVALWAALAYATGKLVR